MQQQSSKAFELAAAYLQITKGTKETNIISKTKLLHRCYEGSTEILLTEKSENKNKYNCKVKLRPSKKTHVSCPDFCKKESGRAVFFVIYYFLLHAFFTHYYLPPGIRWSC